MVRVIVLAVLLAACSPTGQAQKSLKPERSLEPKPPKVATASPQPSEAIGLDVDLPITDPLCGSMQVLHAVGEWAFNTPPAEIAAAVDELEQITAAVAVAIGQIEDGVLQDELAFAAQDLARSIDQFRAGALADGLETITAIRVSVATANLMATTAGISCGIT
jgi:hypothetical protein